MTPALTFVTTCKGRLEFLRKTLPLLAAQPSAACVVVDYDCPDRCGDWVAAHLPQVTVVRIADPGPFNVSRARNAGVAAARTAAICLIDSDVRIASDFVPTVLAQFDARRYFVADPLTGDTSGTVVCARAAFEFAEGYDEACFGWGGEDFDLYDRLEFHRIARAGFPARLVAALSHPDATRTLHRGMADMGLSNSVNLLYSHVKLDLMRLSGARLPADYRHRLYAQVRDACLVSASTRSAQRIEIPFSDGSINRSSIQTSLGYLIDVTQRDDNRNSDSTAARRVTSGRI